MNPDPQITVPVHIRRSPKAKTLPPEVQALADNASKQPSRYLPDLIRFVDHERYWSTHPRVLDICLEQFNPPILTSEHLAQLETLPPIPPFLGLAQVERPPSTSVLQDNIESAILGLVGLSIALNVPSCPESVHSTILSSWPALWTWMDFLYHYPNKDNPFDPQSGLAESQLMLWLSIQRTFTSIFHHGITISTDILNTPRVLKTAIEMWITLPGRLGTHREVPLSAHFLPIAWSLSVFLSSPLTDFRELATGFGGDQTELVSMILKPIQLAVYGGESWTHAFPAMLDVHLNLAMSVPGLYTAHPLKGIICDFCYALAYFSFLPPPTDLGPADSPTTMVKCIDQCLKSILVFASFTGDNLWIIHALRFKLVPSVLRIAPWCTHSFVISNVSLLLVLLQKASIHRPVLKRLQMVMSSKTVVSLSSKIPRKGEFRSNWSKFLEIFNDAILIKAAFDKSEGHARKCAFSECHNFESPKPLRSCSACRDVVYCSRTCQRDDWQVHRRSCDPNRRGRASPLMSPRNTAYFRFFLEWNFKVHRSEIIKLRDRALLDLRTRQPLVLVFHYAVSMHVRHVRVTDRDPHMFGPLPEVHPLLLPCLVVRYGTKNAEVAINLELSGKLFGWYDRTEPSRTKFDSHEGYSGAENSKHEFSI